MTRMKELIEALKKEAMEKGRTDIYERLSSSTELRELEEIESELDKYGTHGNYHGHGNNSENVKVLVANNIDMRFVFGSDVDPEIIKATLGKAFDEIEFKEQDVK